MKGDSEDFTLMRWFPGIPFLLFCPLYHSLENARMGPNNYYQVVADCGTLLWIGRVIMPLGGDQKNKCQVEKIFRMAHKKGLIPLYILKITLRKEVVR